MLKKEERKMKIREKITNLAQLDDDGKVIKRTL
jgi:hypothetical protein